MAAVALRQLLVADCCRPGPHRHCCRSLPLLPARRYSGYRYGAPKGRILQFLLYRRSSPDDNHYAHPLDT